MRRTKTYRISDREEALVAAAAEREGDPFSRFVREAAVQRAAKLLTPEPDSRGNGDGRADRETEDVPQ